MKAQKINYKPTGWQLNSSFIDTDKVQYWSDGVMTTLITKSEAIELVNNKKAFVITGQAVGQLDEMGYSIA